MRIMDNRLYKISGIAAIVLFLSLLAFCGGGEEDAATKPSPDAVAGNLQKSETEKEKKKPNKIIYWNRRREFNDGNDTHLAAAKEIGITPLERRSDIPDASRPLHLICGNMGFWGAEPYVVDRLTHSSPLLVEEAADLLVDIAVNFQDSLKNKQLSPYSIVVTSVLRTDEDVESLSKRNVNAVERSVHCYGTTVDISCKRFVKHNEDDPDARQVDLIAILGEVLRDLKKSGRCYVKYEVKQHCFHITARK